MKLPKPFYRLPIRFDVDHLQAEVAALSQSTWAKHPNEIEGNSAIRLISVDGGENDDVNGAMLPTPHLQRSPYLRQILASFGVVWGRSRLMRLAPGAQVPQHADINHHWFNRVRLHIPAITNPQVRFYCDEENVHMAAGEAWLFDNWRQHRVINPSDQQRIHLVADTSGSAAFWRFVRRSQIPGIFDEQHRFDPNRNLLPLTEHATLAAIMPPAEIEFLILDLRAELAPQNAVPESRALLENYHAMLEAFCQDWRQLYQLHGAESTGWGEFSKLLDSVRVASRELADELIMRTNRVPAHTVLEGRVLRVAMSLPEKKQIQISLPKSRPIELDRPVFIIAAPRSGSTLLFETLAASKHLVTLGGEAHWLIEGIASLQPGAGGVDSNRLTAQHYNEVVGQEITGQILEKLQDSSGNSVSPTATVRFLEKTPKNSLRIPFFNRLFPNALFVYLWRDPRENLSSIMEAWRSGNWKTYNGLRGFDGPWSLLLPPDWQKMNQRPLEEIAAFQWETTNRIILDDLAALSPQRWTAINYAEFISHPARTTEKLCTFIDIEFDNELRRHVSGPLPLSRYTQSPPLVDKWHRNETEILRVLPSIETTWQRLKTVT